MLTTTKTKTIAQKLKLTKTGANFEVCRRYPIENVWSFIVCYFLVAIESQIIYIYIMSICKLN